MDLDGFKEVNDTLGHPVGDALLVRLGERLVGTLRASDTVARLGGDEFGLLLTTLNSAEEALALAQVIIEAMKRPIEVEETQLCLAASIGVAVYPEHGTTTTDLMKHADVAMYEAKRLGKSTSLYQQSSDAHSAERLTLMSQIGTAIADGQMVVHYQPKVRLRDGCPLGVEALVRWEHPELGLIQPDDFVPLAEQSGAIGALTSAVLRSSIEQVQRWTEQGHVLDLAVNISARTLHDQNLMNGIFEELGRGLLPPTRLVLEITETAVMANPQGALRSLERLAELGVRVSVDDFGTGYCSLAYLRDLPIHEIKLDRSYIADMCRGGREAALVHSIIDLGERLGLTIIAEGIEDEETLASLIEAGVALGQGFLFSRPQPAGVLGPWLDESARVRAAEARRPRPRVALAG